MARTHHAMKTSTPKTGQTLMDAVIENLKGYGVGSFTTKDLQAFSISSLLRLLRSWTFLVWLVCIYLCNPQRFHVLPQFFDSISKLPAEGVWVRAIVVVLQLASDRVTECKVYGNKFVADAVNKKPCASVDGHGQSFSAVGRGGITCDL